jgi:hypothetical protein
LFKQEKERMTIEKKINKGELFQFPKTVARANTGVHNSGCLDVTVGDSSKDSFLSKKERLTANGVNADKSGRNFIWVPWMDGAVNYASQQGKDVMSGPFSGCYMIRYKIGGGDWRVAHVHTPGAIDTWNTLASQNGFEIDCGFKPYFRRDSEGNHDKTYGVITNEGKCFRIWASEYQYGSVDPTIGLRKIKEIKEITSLKPADLKVLTPMET